MHLLTRTTRTLLCTAGLLASALLAACGSGDAGRDAILGVDAATLVSVAVTPATSTVPLGAQQQLQATATYSDGSSTDVTAKSVWASASPSVASVASATGLASGVSTGAALLSATYGGKAGSATLTVSAATLQTLALTPATASIATGAPLQYVATGTYSDGTTRDLTASALFSADGSGFASIAASGGLATGASAGTATLTASAGGLSASATLTVTSATLSAIAVTPATASIATGAVQSFVATGTYSDRSSVNLSALATWSSDATGIATVLPGGVTSGLAAGTANIVAAYGGQSGSAVLTVRAAATLGSITVTPATASIAVGATQQLTATGNYADGSSVVLTTSVTWSSASTAVATVTGSGLASGVSAGNAVITATLGSQSGSATLTVTAAAATSLDLGTASTFGVLSGSAITNNSGGTTVVTGDVGAASQTVAPTQTAGYTNYTSGAILQGALNDLQLAIADANSRACTVSVTGNADLASVVFSSNATLPPGVYCVTGALTIGANLTLNGSGLYLFRAGSTFDSVANATVSLTNGASAGNVFWVPVGATTLGANGAFQGAILGQSAAITVGDNTTLQNGRVLSGGAVTLKNNPIAIP